MTLFRRRICPCSRDSTSSLMMNQLRYPLMIIRARHPFDPAGLVLLDPDMFIYPLHYLVCITGLVLLDPDMFIYPLHYLVCITGLVLLGALQRQSTRNYRAQCSWLRNPVWSFARWTLLLFFGDLIGRSVQATVTTTMPTASPPGLTHPALEESTLALPLAPERPLTRPRATRTCWKLKQPLTSFWPRYSFTAMISLCLL